MVAILQVPASFLVLSSIFNCSLHCSQLTVITINSHLWVDNHMQTCRDAWGEVEWSEVEWSEVEWSEVEWGEVEWSEVEWSEVEWSEVEWSEVTQAVLWSDTAHNDNMQKCWDY